MRMSKGSQPPLQVGGQAQEHVAAAFRLAAVPSEKHRSATINQMVSSPFRYVPKRGDASFPAQLLSGRSCSVKFLFSSIEV